MGWRRRKGMAPCGALYRQCGAAAGPSAVFWSGRREGGLLRVGHAGAREGMWSRGGLGAKGRRGVGAAAGSPPGLSRNAEVCHTLPHVGELHQTNLRSSEGPWDADIPPAAPMTVPRCSPAAPTSLLHSMLLNANPHAPLRRRATSPAGPLSPVHHVTSPAHSQLHSQPCTSFCTPSQ